MQAMIFAAGLGTRLKPLTDTMPKAMVPVAGEPLIKRTVLKLKEAGADRIVVNVHHLAGQITSYLAANGNFNADIRISDETDMLLDTGGGLKKAMPLLSPKEPVLIHNVDILSNVRLGEFYHNNLQYDATLLVSSRKTKRYLLFSTDMRLMGWKNIETGEVRSPYSNLKADYCRMYAFSGIHIISPGMTALMEDMPDKFGIMDFYLDNCSRKQIHGCLMEDLMLMDVGKTETLKEAEVFLKNIETMK